ncbi:unnamed protein product [Caenorhabditis brenneri]
MSSLLKKISKLFRNRKKNARNNKGADSENSEELNDDQNLQNSSVNNDCLSLDNQFEILTERLERDNRTLGSGSFSCVKRGTLQIDNNEGNDMRVAIKSARNKFDPYIIRAFHEEIKLLASLAPHPNVLTFIGFVRMRVPEIVTELVESGDLFDLNIREKTDQFNNTEMSTDQRSLCTFDLVSYVYQITNGMEYLASVPCNHRDLALHNVFVSQDNTIRIGDFALAGRHSNNENYKCRMANDQLIPIWWTAPEVMDECESSEKTDIFAFGVCLFELFSLGDCKQNSDPLERILPFPEPEFCPPEIYQFMLKCWNNDPALRPTFTDCFTFFGEFLDRHNRQLRQQIYGKLQAVSEWQKDIRNQVHGRDLVHPEIDVPVINSE